MEDKEQIKKKGGISQNERKWIDILEHIINSYEYACILEGRDLNFREFINFSKKLVLHKTNKSI